MIRHLTIAFEISDRHVLIHNLLRMVALRAERVQVAA